MCVHGRVAHVHVHDTQSAQRYRVLSSSKQPSHTRTGLAEACVRDSFLVHAAQNTCLADVSQEPSQNREANPQLRQWCFLRETALNSLLQPLHTATERSGSHFLHRVWEAWTHKADEEPRGEPGQLHL